MQLDLLYKGLPSANADTRKFRVQIHSNAISFIQHEGCGSEGGGGRERVTLYTSSLPSTLRPPWTFVPAPQHHLPTQSQRGWKKKPRGKKEKVVAGLVLPQGWGCPQPGHPPGVPQPLALPSPSPLGQNPGSREMLPGGPGV